MWAGQAAWYLDAKVSVWAVAGLLAVLHLAIGGQEGCLTVGAAHGSNLYSTASDHHTNRGALFENSILFPNPVLYTGTP